MTFPPHYDNSFIAHARIHELKMTNRDNILFYWVFSDFMDVLCNQEKPLGNFYLFGSLGKYGGCHVGRFCTLRLV